MKIGVIGAGFIGRALAKLAVRHGHDVMISNSRDPATLASTAAALGCKTGTLAQAADFGELLILAIPLKAVRDLDPRPFAGKVVLDANNYYPERDEVIPELDNHTATTSGMLAGHLIGATVVKAFNAILHDDIERDARPRGAADRRALPIAGDDEAAKQVVANIVDQFGFDVVDGGVLEESWRFERAMPAYCMWMNAQQLVEAIAAARRGVEMPHGAWRDASAARAQASAASAKGKSHRGSFSGRGAWDIVDAQFHMGPEQGADASMAAMDALGIRSAVLDELWGFDGDGEPVPHARLANGACRPLSPLSLTASLEHPGRFSFLQRVTRGDPQLPQLIPILASTPGCRALRISITSDDERSRLVAGEWDEVLRLAQQNELPVCVMVEDAGRILPPVMRRFDGLQVIVDHCGWVRTPEQWAQVLALARMPNAWLKWSHARKAFRRHTDPEAAQQREFVRALEAFGVERVLWASDASYEESKATWSELLDFVIDNPALSVGDRAWVAGRAARHVLRWAA